MEQRQDDLQTANSACLHLETDQQSPKSQEVQGLALDEMEVVELALRWTWAINVRWLRH